MLAITGTDGKTTTTELTVAILRAAGLRTAALGNTDVPLVDGVDATGERDARRVRRRVHELPTGVDAAASGPTPRRGSTSLPTISTGTRRWRRYEAAKARIWDLQRPGDVAIGFVDDPIVMAQPRRSRPAAT